MNSFYNKFISQTSSVYFKLCVFLFFTFKNSFLSKMEKTYGLNIELLQDILQNIAEENEELVTNCDIHIV